MSGVGDDAASRVGGRRRRGGGGSSASSCRAAPAAAAGDFATAGLAVAGCSWIRHLARAPGYFAYRDRIVGRAWEGVREKYAKDVEGLL